MDRQSKYATILGQSSGIRLKSTGYRQATMIDSGKSLLTRLQAKRLVGRFDSSSERESFSSSTRGQLNVLADRRCRQIRGLEDRGREERFERQAMTSESDRGWMMKSKRENKTPDDKYDTILKQVGDLMSAVKQLTDSRRSHTGRTISESSNRDTDIDIDAMTDNELVQLKAKIDQRMRERQSERSVDCKSELRSTGRQSKTGYEGKWLNIRPKTNRIRDFVEENLPKDELEYDSSEKRSRTTHLSNFNLLRGLGDKFSERQVPERMVSSTKYLKKKDQIFRTMDEKLSLKPSNFNFFKSKKPYSIMPTNNSTTLLRNIALKTSHHPSKLDSITYDRPPRSHLPPSLHTPDSRHPTRSRFSPLGSHMNLSPHLLTSKTTPKAGSQTSNHLSAAEESRNSSQNDIFVLTKEDAPADDDTANYIDSDQSIAEIKAGIDRFTMIK